MKFHDLVMSILCVLQLEELILGSQVVNPKILRPLFFINDRLYIQT